MATHGLAARITHGIPALLLVVTLIAIDASGLHPGVSSGDSAELQYAAPMGGICHPPGYQTEVTLGGLFVSLPLGGSAAWRLNLLMLICGVTGALLMYLSIQRITMSRIAALSAAGLLALSVIYWTHSLVAEAYVFYALFLLSGLYAAVRFTQSDRTWWLCAAMLSLGIAIGDRPSELPVLAGFLGLWYGSRTRVTMTRQRIVASVLLLVLPFVCSVASVVMRSDPRRLANRDDFLEETILGRDPRRIDTAVDVSAPLVTRVGQATAYCLGGRWAGQARARIGVDTAWSSFRKYVWLHSGAGAFGLRSYPGGETNPEPRGGVSIGPLGLLLALLATIGWRDRPGWLLLGWGFVLGNLAFVLLYPRWDNLTFTIPGAIGWAFLAGLGASAPAGATSRGVVRYARLATALAAVLFLFAINRPFASPRTDFEQAAVRWRAEVAAAGWPDGSVIVSTYWPAMTLRYLFFVETARTDIHVLNADRRDWPALIRALNEAGHPVFVPREYARRADLPAFLRDTPPALAALGFVRIIRVPGEQP